MGDLVDELVIGGGLTVPVREIEWRFSSSGGPGGQHANTSNTRVEATFDIEHSSLPQDARERLINRLGPVVRVVCSDERSQWQNRRLALVRLEKQLSEANRRTRQRRPTRRTRGSQLRRLDKKSARSTTKKLRRAPGRDD